MIIQFLYQAIVLVVPLIVAPYLTRSLGESSLGIYSYSYSIAYYFVLFCMLGIVKHGQRLIAERKDNEIELRKTFWSLYTIHALFSFLGLIFYILFCIKFCRNNVNVYLAQSFYVLSALFDITWLFYGIEKFKVVIIRNAIVKLVELVFIILFVKNPNDLLTYTYIMASSILLSQMSLFLTVLKNLKPICFGYNDIKEHIKPLFVLSISVFAISMFTVFDKTLLGIITNTDNVAFYEYSNKIINIPKMFIVVVGTVLFPRACHCIANQDLRELKRYYQYSIRIVYFIGFSSIFGLLAVSDLFVKIYYGDNFIICSSVVKTLTPIILIIGLGDVIRSQFLIPLKKDFQYTVCVIINALINIVFSILLIPKYEIYGAVIGTLFAELFGLVYQIYLVRKYINVKEIFVISVPYFFSGICMYIILSVVKHFYNSSLIHLLIQISIGGIVFCVISFFFSKIQKVVNVK